MEAVICISMSIDQDRAPIPKGIMDSLATSTDSQLAGLSDRIQVYVNDLPGEQREAVLDSMAEAVAERC